MMTTLMNIHAYVIFQFLYITSKNYWGLRVYTSKCNVHVHAWANMTYQPNPTWGILLGYFHLLPRPLNTTTFDYTISTNLLNIAQITTQHHQSLSVVLEGTRSNRRRLKLNKPSGRALLIPSEEVNM